MKTQKVYVAAGCFWGIQEAFRVLPGVTETNVGYAGGTTKNPTYDDVWTGKTGHAETVEIEFDPSKISFEAILDTFWEIHDPTTLDAQVPDIGSQYRSAIFYINEEQRKIAEKSKEKLGESEKFAGQIVTEITFLDSKNFYIAEEYHQKYMCKVS